MTGKVTVIQHNESVPLDRYGTWLADAGVDIQLVKPFDGDAVPTAAEVTGGLLVLGGTWTAYSDADAPWLPATRQLLADAVDANVPTLAICLGHQLLAAALGGEIVVASPERELGLFQLSFAKEAEVDPVLGPAIDAARVVGSAWVIEAHNDAVSVLPRGVAPLASTSTHANQAFRVGSALGIQFHPEASPELVRQWAERDESLDAAAVEAGVRELDPAIAAFGAALLAGFVDQIRN